jgi:hypothetical protein
MKDNRNDENRRSAEAQQQSPRKQEPQPKKQDEQFDEQALDNVLRDCPL